MIGLGIGIQFKKRKSDGIIPFDPSKLQYQGLWTCNGKKNTDADKNIPNLVDSSNPIILQNFLFNEYSGYSPYYQNLVAIQPNNTGLFNVSSSSVHNRKFEAIVNLNAYDFPSYWTNREYSGLEWKVLLTSNIPDFRLRLVYYAVNVSVIARTIDIKSNEITTIPAIDVDKLFNKTPSTQLLNPMNIGDWFQLEEIPTGNSGLYFDAVDDTIQTQKALPILDQYTIVGDIHIPYWAAGGIGKDLNWYWYGSQIYINGSSSLITNNTTRVVGFNSNGLIVRENNSFEGLVGSVEKSEKPLKSLGATKSLMIFNSLAIVPQILNEEEIRSVYSYLKTLKANNLEPIISSKFSTT